MLSKKIHKGIELASMSEGVTPRRFVHARKDEWVITSNTAPNEDILSCPLLKQNLPGYLGCYFYPADAVFHVTNTLKTRKNHLEEVIRRENLRLLSMRNNPTLTKMNHLTLIAREEEVIEEDEYEPDDDVVEEDNNEENEVDEIEGEEWEEEEEVEEEDDCVKGKHRTSGRFKSE